MGWFNQKAKGNGEDNAYFRELIGNRHNLIKYEEEVNHGMMFAGVPDEEKHRDELVHTLALATFIFLLILILFI